jgi:ribonuclease P protein component
LEQGKSRSISFRFRRNDRLLKAAAFGRVFEKANRSQDKWFTVLCRAHGSREPNDSREPDGGVGARLGLAISKKHCRKATARNRIKRIVRESFRHHQAELGNLDVVVINRSAAAGATSRQLFDSLAAHWRRCGPAGSAPEGQE